MARRSLRASIAGIEKAKRAFKCKEWTQADLANEVGIETRQPIWKFFTGKPIEREIFREICFRLDLDWQEIAALSTESSLTVKKEEHGNHWDIDLLVQEVRSQRVDKIQAQCGTIRLLDIAQPIELEDIYVNAQMLEDITCQRWLDKSELQDFHSEGFDRFCWDEVGRERVFAMQAVTTHLKLMILGKPGSGKTTLLQYIAMKCNQGELLSDKVPIFIRLRNFAEDANDTGNYSLLSYIYQELDRSDISKQQVKTLLHHGKALILLDGLDEVQEKDGDEVLKQIRKLSEDYYKNQLIITSRIGNQHYQFEGFTDIEIADFNSSQIEAFAQQWFVNVGRNCRETGKALTNQFMQQLLLPENQQIRELAVTPLLLNLICSVFSAKSGFPANKVGLYRQGLNILLSRWDEARGIKRDRIDCPLSLPQKILLLSQIATITFEQEHYFFSQSNVEQYIMNYLRTLPSTPVDLDVLKLSSEEVLKSIEAQHGLLVERARGIYSFSHVTFQEYLSAKNFVTSSDLQFLNKTWLN